MRNGTFVDPVSARSNRGQVSNTEQKRMIEERGKVMQEVGDLRDRLSKENRSMTSDEHKRLGELTQRFEGLTRSINTGREAVEATWRSMEVTMNGDGTMGVEPVSQREERHTPEQRAKLRKLAFAGWARSQSELPMTRSQASACHKLRINPNSKYFHFRLGQGGSEQRAMGVGTGSAGGYLVPQGFSGVFEKFLLATSPLRQVATIMRTETGNAMPYPTINDTSNLGELMTENSEAVGADAAVSQVNFGAFKYGSKLIPVSFELMNDAEFNVEEMIGSIAGERIGRSQNAAFTTGTGSAQPQGIVSGASAGVTAAGAAAIVLDDLLGLFHSIDPAYRDSPAFGFMCHDNVLKVIRSIKDTTGRPIFTESYMSGKPPTILGKPVHINQAMASAVTTGQKTVLAGDFSKFVIRDAGEIRVRRLDERYAEKDQVGFLAILRSDSRVINSAALKVLTQA